MNSPGSAIDSLQPVRLPPPVVAGARVGVAALSGPLDPGCLEAGLEALRELGFEPVAASNLRSRHSLFAGTEQQRLGGFDELVRDESIRAVMFARGGHGMLRLLPKIDWRALSRVPRAYIGYSDLTPLLLEIPRRLALTTLHGPMVAVELARGLLPDERESLLEALAGRFATSLPVRRLSAPGAVRQVEGPLLGGCLTMLTATLATEYRPRLEGALVFLEDVGEPLYSRDRMLTQLRLSGCLRGARALIVGHFEAQEEGDLEDSAEWRQLLTELGESESLPVVTGLGCGHGSPNLTLPLGQPARLDLAREQLDILPNGHFR